MRRMGLVVRAGLLKEAKRALGVRSYSAAVYLALEEVLKIRRIQSLPQFFGQGVWKGNLAEMREDRPRRRRSGR
jgi:hypothetical protein